jgi:signal peptidase I
VPYASGPSPNIASSFNWRAAVNSRRRPWAAVLGTLLQPGLGHLYAGAPERAVAAVLINILAIPIWGICLLSLASRPALALIVSLSFVGLTIWLAYDAARIARHQPSDYALRHYNTWSAYLTWIVALGFLSAQVLALTKLHLVQAFRVPSGSMAPSLLVGDMIMVGMWRPMQQLERGTVVVFESIEEPGLKVIKRVVGTPGDTIAMVAGSLRRNGEPVFEPYVIHEDLTRHEDAVQRAKMRNWQILHVAAGQNLSTYAPDLQDWGPVVVPRDSLLLLGDNRDSSYDGRYYGFVPTSRVLGRPMFVYYSYDPTSPLPHPWANAIRWDRIGVSVFR